MDGLIKLIDFLEKLDELNIYYRLSKIRDRILVEVVVPCERWDVEFMCGGTVVVEKFKSDSMYDESELENLFK